jgi:hypothetical protein
MARYTYTPPLRGSVFRPNIVNPLGRGILPTLGFAAPLFAREWGLGAGGAYGGDFRGNRRNLTEQYRSDPED